MTFEDAIAYSRNVVAAKVALGLDKTTKRRVGDPPLDVDPVRLRRSRPGSTWPARSAGIVRDPAIRPWRQIDLANGAFGQGVAVTPLQLAIGLRVDDQRRPADPAAHRQGGRRQRPGRSAPRAAR